MRSKGALALWTAVMTALAAIAPPFALPGTAGWTRAWADGDEDGEAGDGGAGDGGDDAAVTDVEPEASVAVVVVGPGGAPLAPAIKATVQVSMERALERDPRLAVIDTDDRLAMRAGRVPKVDVAEGHDLLAMGEELLQGGQIKGAIIRLTAAVNKLERVLAWASKQDLARAQLLLGTAQAMTGDAAAAQETFAALQVWRPDEAPDEDLAGDRTMTAWEAAQAELAARGRGAIDIDSSPEGALAYVDGKLVGFTPTEVDGMVAGTHYVTLRRVGHERRVEAVAVEGGGRAAVAVTLTPSDRARELAAAEAAFAAGVLGERSAGDGGGAAGDVDLQVQEALATIRALIDVDHVVLVVPAKKGGQYAVSVHATDGGARLAGVSVKVGDRDLETAFAAAAGKLYERVSTAPVASRPHPRPRRPVDEPRRRPQLYKRWWFWAGVGAGAVAILAISALAADDGPPGCPSGDSCGTVVFRF